MNWIFWGILLVFLAIAIIFTTINAFLSFSKKDSFKGCFLHGLSKVLADVAIGLIIIMVPALILYNCLKPKPADVMPSYYYDGTYADMAPEEKDIYAETIILDCTDKVTENETLMAHFDRAHFYFYTGNFDLAKNDLLFCYKNSKDWRYAFDLGVICGYLQEYYDSIKYFEEALDKEDIPIQKRGLAMDHLTLIRSYFGDWLYSLLGWN